MNQARWVGMLGAMATGLAVSLSFGGAPSALPSFSKSCPPFQVTFQVTFQVKATEPIYEFQNLVSCGGKAVTLETLWHSKSFEEAKRNLEDLTGVKDGYLFTPGSCGGGNAWRCEVEYVIACNRGPQVLGALGRHVDWKNPGESLKNGLFQDGFDGLEINPFTCHAAAPSFGLFLERKKERFVVAKDATWRSNKVIVGNFQTRLEAGTGKNETEEEAKSAFLGALAIARLCDQKKEWESTLRRGRKVFGRAKADKMAKYVVKTLSKYRPARIPE
jgi:hypothetical protein